MQVSGSGAEGRSSVVVQGGELCGIEDPMDEMHLLRHEIDITIDQRLKGVEKRLQVSNALATLKQQLAAALDARFQGFDTRLQVCACLSMHLCMHEKQAASFDDMLLPSSSISWQLTPMPESAALTLANAQTDISRSAGLCHLPAGLHFLSVHMCMPCESFIVP